MDSQEVGGLLEECLQAAQQSTQPSEAERLNYCSCRDMLCAELASLLQEAMDMKWPFVPEKWQYKQSVSASDKTNLNDLVSKNLSQLLAVLKASIVAQEARTALAVVFLVDRFLYWTDESSRLLKITKLLHRRHRDTPVAPQLVIRQARVYFNSGKLQKAEYILSSLIKGKTFKWLLENDVGYAVYLVADHQKEREGKGTMRQDALMANKDSLTRYVSHYREVLEEVRFKRAYEKAEEGKALAGFGKYPSEKLQDLYESKEPRKVSYVDFLRTMKSTCNPGTKMEVAVAYVLHRDKHWGTAPGKRTIKRKQVQSTRGQPTSVSWPIRKKPKYNWKRT